MRSEFVHGCKINFEDETKDALIYLENHLNPDEFKTIFDHAHFHQKAYFPDRGGHHYSIEYKDGQYFLGKV